MTTKQESRRASLTAAVLDRSTGTPSWAEVLAAARELERDGVEVLDLRAEDDARDRWPYEATTLAAALLRSTERIAVIVPVDADGAAPYHFARYLATLGYAGPGRIVLETEGIDGPARRERQEEYLDVIRRLWHSWDRAAIVADKESGVFYDPAQAPDLGFDGRHFSVRGALNLPEPPGPFPQVIVRDREEARA